MRIVFIINGENVPVEELDEDEPLLVGRDRALRKSGNTGRPLEEWELRNERGDFLSPWDTPSSLDLLNHVRLFVSLRVACGGSFALAC